jgi:hypothetical protein
LAGGVVERGRAVAAPPDLPAEDARVEIGRARDALGRHLDVTDLAVREAGFHFGSPLLE